MSRERYPADPQDWDFDFVSDLVSANHEENIFLEYKTRLKPKGENKFEDKLWKEKLEKEFVAFANARGGFLLFGISDDSIEINPIEEDSQENFAQWLKELLTGTNPVVDFSVSEPIEVQNSGRVILVVKIEESENKPVSTKNSSYYIRMGESKHPIDREYLQTLFVDKDRRQQGIRNLKLVIGRFFELCDEYGQTQEKNKLPPDFNKLPTDNLKNVLKENARLYSEESCKDIIDEVYEAILEIERLERYHKLKVEGKMKGSLAGGSDTKNLDARKKLNKKSEALKVSLEKLVDELQISL